MNVNELEFLNGYFLEEQVWAADEERFPLHG